VSAAEAARIAAAKEAEVLHASQIALEAEVGEAGEELRRTLRFARARANALAAGPVSVRVRDRERVRDRVRVKDRDRVGGRVRVRVRVRDRVRVSQRARLTLTQP